MDSIEYAKSIIDEAEAIIITAGAGMGVDSGLPDFRGDNGFWKAYPVAKELGYNFSQMADPKWFKEDPKFAWAFYGHRLNLYRDTNPHEGFALLLDLVRRKNDNYFIYTSNVDGQFQKAGFDKNKIVEVHGSIHHMQCSQLCKKIVSAKEINIDVDMELFQAQEIPFCKKCGAVMRPNILMFNDWEWRESRVNEQHKSYRNWLKNALVSKIAIIEIGAGMAISTIRIEGQRVAKQLPFAKLIRINPRDYTIDPSLGLSLSCGAKDGLDLLLNAKSSH